MKYEEGYVYLEEGLKIHFQSIGSGVNTVIIPGAAGLAGDLESLANSRRLVFYDQRGRGQSDFDPDGSNIWSDYEVKDLDAIRHHFGLERMSLLGWSYNGGIAALYAADFPERVDRLVMMCPIPPRSSAPYNDPERTKILSEKRLDPARAEQLSVLKEQGLDNNDPESYCREYIKVKYPRQMGKPESLDQMRSDPCAYPNEWPQNKAEHTRIHVPAESMVWDWRERVSTVKAETLIIHGEEDLIPLESSQEWFSVLPQARLLCIRGSGHFPHLEAPDIFYPAVDIFLDGAWPEGIEPAP